MARPALDYIPTKVVIQASPKLIAYLDLLVKKEAYGNTRPEVAKAAIWRLVEDLIGKNFLKEIPDEQAESTVNS